MALTALMVQRFENLYLDNGRAQAKKPEGTSGFLHSFNAIRALGFKASGRSKHTKWHGRLAHVLTGETPVPRDGYGSISTASRLTEQSNYRD